jgi:hypothetical protein
MALIRWILIALSAVAGGSILYLWFSSSVRPQPVWPVYVIPAACALNIYYLLMSGRAGRPPMGTPRLLRLINLWLEAKEQELKQRVNPKE